MKVLVWGLGYVGTVVSACLSELGHEVIGIDVDPEKVEKFNRGLSPIKEPNVDELITKGIEQGRLRAVVSGKKHVAWADISLICVGTPSAPDGSPVLDYIYSVAQEIGLGLQESSKYHVIVLRSTVFAGVTRHRLIPLLEKYSEGKAGLDFGVAINPEFLRETTAVKDFFAPPQTIIGQLDSSSGDCLEQLYQGVEAPIHRIAIEEAEVLKVVNNAFHALKVGFANEIGRLCDPIDVDSRKVMDLLCADTKLNISSKYLKPGFAFGGSCLPKDVRSLVFHARDIGENLPIMESIMISNMQHIEAARLKIHDLGVRSIAVLGLSFKAGTDDLRESPILSLINLCWKDGLKVLVYDPDVQMDQILGSNRRYLELQLPQIYQIIRSSLDEVLNECEGVVLSQDRLEFTEAIHNLKKVPHVLNLTNWQTVVSKSPSFEKVKVSL